MACFGDSFFDKPIDVIIEAVSNDTQIGAPASSKYVNPTSEFIEITPGKSVKITLALNDEFEGKFTVYAKSPASGIILSEINLETDYL